MKKNGHIIKCRICSKERYVTPSLVMRGRGIYCSPSCRSKIAVKAMLKVRGERWKDNVRKSLIERFRDETKHPRWKGDDVGYFGIHDWITKHYGQPKKCEICGLNDVRRKYHWANISDKYIRDIKDWKRMCVSCHRKFDYSKR